MFLIVDFIIQELVYFLLRLMNSEHLFFASIILWNILVRNKLDFSNKVIYSLENTLNLLFNGAELGIKLVSDSIKLLALLLTFDEFFKLFYSILKGPFVDWKGSPLTRWLSNIMRLIKDQDTVLNNAFILGVQLTIKQVIVRHEKKVADGFDKMWVIVRTESMFLPQFLYFLVWNYLVFELISCQFQNKALPFVICAHCLLYLLLIFWRHVWKFLLGSWEAHTTVSLFVSLVKFKVDVSLLLFTISQK